MFLLGTRRKHYELEAFYSSNGTGDLAGDWPAEETICRDLSLIPPASFAFSSISFLLQNMSREKIYINKEYNKLISEIK